MPHRSSDLANLADQFFQQPPRMDLADVGPAAADLRKRLTHTEDRTRPFVASVFWQAYTSSAEFAFFLDQVRRADPDMRVRLMQVVRHSLPGGIRYDLLVLADGIADGDTFYETEAGLDRGELEAGSARFVNDLLPAVSDPELLRSLDHAEIAAEAVKAQDFRVLLFPAPPTMPNALVPSRPLEVREPDTNSVSTVGVHAVNDGGQHGVTVAWHAIQDCRRGAVRVNGAPGQVIGRADPLSDSAFVSAPEEPPSGRPPARPLTKLVPRQHEPVTFDGFSSGTGRGQVTGCSPQLPFVSPHAQLVVTTGPISKPGDSGAALRDGQGVLLGFCHETSAFGAANPYSSWIWAESVFNVHRLT